MANDTLKIIVETIHKGDGAKKASEEISGLQKAIKLAVGAMAAMKTAQAAVDFIEMGAGVNRQRKALDGLAKDAGTTSDAIIKAMQEASGYTVDSMSAMGAASRAMLLDVADTPEEFERITIIAKALGQAMGVDAVTSINDFISAAGRQSKQIADNL